MKTNNRPTIKLVEWEVRTKSDFLLWNSPDDTAIWDGERTGNTREVERPMNDTEYIEYLEEQVIDTFSKLVSVEELSKQTISTLEKENKELKEQSEEYLKYKEEIKLWIVDVKEYKDQFLKVVESVLDKHKPNWNFEECSCGIEGEWYDEHTLQEIKKEMEK